MATLRKIVIKLTLLLDASDRGRLDSMTLEQIAQEMDEGAYIGTFSMASDEVIHAAELQDELFAVGNDGTFFDDAI